MSLNNIRHFGARIVFAAILVAGPALAEKPKTIVGWWAYPGGLCAPIAGAISIEPMALWSDDVRCDFTSVVRDGNTVTWKGSCGYGQGSEVEEVPNETVTATEIDGKLELKFGSLGDEPALERCNPNE
jgi:hypothetical protein